MITKKLNIKKLLFVVAMVLGAFIGTENVFAATLQYDFTGYYYERSDQNGNHYSSWKLEDYRMDGNVAYCIEPGVPEGVHYGEGTWEDIGVDEDVAERVTLIAYYGYTYPGHQTMKFRAATQGLIWATIMGNNSKVTYSTERYGNGTPLDISSEEAEIERLISTHYTRPSFNGQYHTLQVGQSITLHDNNGVLSNYAISVSGAEYSVSGNDLTITPTANGEISINLTKKMPYENEYKIYYGDDIQNMIVPGSTDPVKAKVVIDSYYGQVDLRKTDVETGIAQGQATLENAVYGVYTLDGTLVTKMTTDSNGYAKSDAVLSYGSYYVKEISPSTGYYLDETKYYFDSNGTVLVSTNVTERVIKNFISILKQYDYVDGNTTFLNAEKGITFEIYYPDGRMFDTITTDKNGYATLEIPYGIWKFHQVNTNTGFEKIYDFYITVDENSPLEHYYNILNNKLSAYLQIVKVDEETKQTIALANTTFRIYNSDINQYVSQYVGGKVYDRFTTDENGVVVTYLKLEAGNYKIVEIESPSGYVKDADGLNFTIGNNTHYAYTNYGAIVTVYFNNSPIKGQIEINKTGESVVIKDGSFSYEEKPLENVTFEIYASEDILTADGNYMYYNKGTLVDTIITDNKGYAISKELPLGKYEIVETRTQDGYVLSTNIFYATLSEIDNMTRVVYESFSELNYLKKGTLEFTKTDVATDKGIKDTKIEIYTENDELIFSGYTDETGHIIIDNLFTGKFYIVETEASTGYILNEEKVFFEITEDGEIVKAKMTNEKIKGDLEFTKTDLSTDEALPNTLIEIYNADTEELIFSGYTDEFGKITIKDIEYGNYYIIEKNAPEGYVLNEEKMYFSILENGEIIKSNMTNEKIKGNLVFAKVDENGNPLAGVTIDLYKADGTLIGTYVTDQDGLVIVENLEYGDYMIKEIATIDGYELNDDILYFSIVENGADVNVNMINVKLPQTDSNDYTTYIAISLLGVGAAIISIASTRKKKTNKNN